MGLKKWQIVAIAVACAGVTTWLGVRLLTTDRQRVERVIRRLTGRIEARDAGGFCLLLTEDYSDNSGSSRAALRASLSRVLPQLGSASIRIEDLEVEVSGETARADFLASCVATARRHGRQPPWRWETRVRLELRKHEGEWRVRKAAYRLPPIARRALGRP